MQRIIHHVKGHYHKHYRSRFAERAHWVFMFDGALVLIILGLLTFGSYFAFFYDPPRDAFRAAIVSENVLRGGEDALITVRVSNESKKDLHDASLVVHFPAEFRAVGTIGNIGQVEIGELKGGASKEFSFTGLLIGPPKTASVYVHVRATRADGQTDERLTQAEISWKENLIAIGYETPDSFIAGQATPFRLKIKNGTTLNLERLRVTPKFPETFKIKLASPPLSKDGVLVNDLRAGEEVAIEFVGVYSGNEPTVELGASLWWAEGQHETLIADSVDRRQALSPNLKMEAFLDTKETSITAGDGAAVMVRYANEGTFTLENVQFGIDADVRLTRESVPGIVSAKPPKIDRLEPGQKGEFAAVVWTKETFPAYVLDPKLKLTPTARFSVKEPRIAEALISGTPTEAKIVGQADLAMAARYFTSEGDQLGRGTLPPRVGKETRYWISVGVTGGTSMIKDAKVEVLLPKNVEWTGKASATAGDAPRFDAARGVIVWTIGELPAHAGVSVEAVGASFEVALTPSADQIGTMPGLATAAGFSGTDSWTETLVVDSHSTVTTALPNDAFIRGRTTVRP
jgi:hypothetical protein